VEVDAGDGAKKSMFRVTWRHRASGGEQKQQRQQQYVETTEDFDTVLSAIGRDPVTNTMNLDKAGVQLHPSYECAHSRRHAQLTQ
jgi:pyruvate/2-oxoglutarate dehydrogenase complex dihydrolipoamide dehydrogenase (E3) component